MLVFLAPWTAICAVVFLGASGFFTAWDGVAASVRRPRGASADEAPRVWSVLVVGEDEAREVAWPAAVVEGRGLPIDPLAIPPDVVPPERPRTHKSRFQLHFLVEAPEGGEGWVTVPTTSPASLGVALGLFVVGLAIRNMAWSGSPVGLQRREHIPPDAPPPAGTPAAPPSQRRAASKQGPPPPRPRTGPRR